MGGKPVFPLASAGNCWHPELKRGPDKRSRRDGASALDMPRQGLVTIYTLSWQRHKEGWPLGGVKRSTRSGFRYQAHLGVNYDDFGCRFSSGELMGSEDLCLAGAWWERNYIETESRGFLCLRCGEDLHCWRPSEDEDGDE